MKFLSLALLGAILSVNALANEHSIETFAASSLVVRQVMDKNLLQTHQYDSLFKAALERDANTQIAGIENCEPSSGAFQCSLAIEAGEIELKLLVNIHNGSVIAAQKIL